LTDKINAVLDRDSVLIHADAGYGKTWLLQDFINATNPPIIIWYTFTKDPLDALRFVHEVASECARQTEKVGLETLKYIRERGEEADADEALALLLDEAANADRAQILLIFEDLHNISDENIHSCILAIITSRSINLRVVLTSRLPFPRGQAKLVAQEQLTVIERPELEFTFDEVQEYFSGFRVENLSTEQIQFLYERTHGWIAAVGLAVDLLQTQPDQSDQLFKHLIGYKGNIYDFFAEEVYSSQSVETKLLLKRLGVARSIHSEIVNMFTGRSDGGQVLKDLAGRNTFLVEDQIKNGQFRLHTLFAEFLTTRFLDEEGPEAVRESHRGLANYYLSQREWFLTIEHAIDARDWEIAVQCLEIIGQVGVSLGYGKTFLTWIEKIPEEMRLQSASLCELVGLSAFQIGDLDTASQEFERANNLYEDLKDGAALNRLEYYTAEISLDKGTITPEEFLKSINRVISWSYQHNEILFGVQVEHRYIQIGQTISTKYSNLMSKLIKRGEELLARIEQLGSEYDLIRAKVLASQAHLYFQLVTFAFQQETGKVLMREKLGHPIPMEERVSQARMVIGTFNAVLSLYHGAEEIAKGESDIEWALIRTSHLMDFAHHLSQVFLLGSKGRAETSPQNPELNEDVKRQLYGMLAEFDKCVEIFGKYHYKHALAKTLCDAADIYDLLKDVENRNRLAKEALKIIGTSGFVEIIQRANRILENQGTFTALLESIDDISEDETLANLGEKGKSSYVNTFLQSFSGEVEAEMRREAIASDVDDMVAAAKQRIEWCRHVQIIQDLRHTRSLDTMYRSIPDKLIVCMELGYQSPNSGHSFEKLWPMFKGVYCLGCTSRSLR
jgi:tetratricopeptide (TPR) repeat protein